LEELEGISVHSSGVPSAMLMHARTSISRAEQVLGLRDVAHSPATLAEDEGDPQPCIAREVLERLFHYRNPHQ
jgi:hypothetical protein